MARKLSFPDFLIFFVSSNRIGMVYSKIASSQGWSDTTNSAGKLRRYSLYILRHFHGLAQCQTRRIRWTELWGCPSYPVCKEGARPDK
jgi:hypothetical protein